MINKYFAYIEEKILNLLQITIWIYFSLQNINVDMN